MKPEETKRIEGKPNNQSRATIIFNELINRRKDIMKKLYDSVDYGNLNFKYIGPTNDVSFYEYMDSKELFNEIKDNQINFNDAVKREKEILNKISSIKIGKRTTKQMEVIGNFEKFYISREEVINFFRDCGKMILDASYRSKQNGTMGKGLKILTPRQMLQRLPIALAQVKAGNNSKSLLNEIRKIVYSLYQAK